jgi:rhodanese-related sulfurtransferase
VGGLDARLVLVCAHGYSTSLAAALLQDLGFANATDLDGGFTAWQERGLPVRPAPGAHEDATPGMGPPDP